MTTITGPIWFCGQHVPPRLRGYDGQVASTALLRPGDELRRNPPPEKGGGMRYAVPPYELLPPLIQLSQPITRQLGSGIIDGGFPVGDSMVKLFEQQTKCGQVTFPYRAVVIAI